MREAEKYPEPFEKLDLAIFGKFGGPGICDEKPKNMSHASLPPRSLRKIPTAYGFLAPDGDPHEFEEVLIGKPVQLAAITKQTGNFA